MKKNISINISGIIFHIEEDGYENLRRYLDSINKYFSTFEDSTEIMADIESRIAEIFLSKLNEGKQVITLEDVNALITTMGSVSDFKAAEETDAGSGPSSAPPPPHANAGSATGAAYTYAPPKSLMRDQKRKILGGVCSGIANYMNVDALWVRLIFAILAFAWGLTIFIYIIMWIVVPGSYELNETEVGKKMYRDPERKVLGGVSGGVASYLNIDILAVRILFVLLAIAGGFGFFLYIILWVILPEARTLTDRMQMQGEPVTLSNIESSLKKNQESQAAEESDLAKVLLFPFRVIGMVLQALAKAIGPLAEALRVLVGIFIVGVGLALLFSLLVAGGAAIGIFSSSMVNMPIPGHYADVNLPVDAFIRAFPGWTILAGFLAAIIPALMIILLGISVIARRIVFSPGVGWAMFVVFLISLGLLSVGIPQIVYAFKESAEYEIQATYTPTGKTAVLKVREVGMDDYDGASLTLKGHNEKNFKLVQQFRSQGKTRAQAIENAKMVNYNVEVQDSVFTFDSNITFSPDAIFRGQELDMILYIPYEYPFTLNESSSIFIDQYIDWNYRDGNTWKMTERGLECITCPAPSEEEIAMEELRDFDQIDLNGIFDVRIHQGSEYAVEMKGPDAQKKMYKIYRSGKTLVIDFEGKRNFNWDMKRDNVINDQVYISITTPHLEKLEATGFGSIEFEDLETPEMEFEVRGPIDIDGRLNSQHVVIHLSGKADLDIEGHSERMNADVEFASSLNAYDFEVQEANVEVRGASSAKLNVTRRLEIEEGMASDIDYRGNPEVITNK